MGKRLISKTYDILGQIRKSNYLLFIRARGHETVGLLTKIDHVYDGSWGVMRKLALGLKLNGEPFEEYLDRKNKRTGQLEDLIQMQTDLILVTARNSSSPEDDDNENFSYLVDNNTSNMLKDRLDELSEKDRIISTLKKKTDEALRLKDNYQRQLETAQSEANSYKSKMSNFAEQLGQARARAEYYRTQLKNEQIEKMKLEGFLSQKLGDAHEAGKLFAKDSADVVLDGAKKQIKAKTELDKIIGPQDGVSRDDFQNFEKKIFDKIDSSGQNTQTQAKPPKEEKSNG